MTKHKPYVFILASLASFTLVIWGLMDALQMKEHERLRWQNTMAEVATSDASQIEAWLATFTNQTQRLAADPRIRHLLVSDGTLPDAAEILANGKRALVEFNVLFGAKFIYLFNVDGTTKLTLEGSPPLADDTMTAMTTTFDAKAQSYQPLIRSANTGYLGTALAVKPQADEPLGYVMAVYPLQAAMERLGSPASPDRGTSRYIVRFDHQGRPQAMAWPDDDMPQPPIAVSKTKAQWPTEPSLISQPFPAQVPFTHLDSKPIYAWLSQPLVDGHWATLSVASPDLVYRDVPKRVVLIVLRTLLGIIVVWAMAVALFLWLKSNPLRGIMMPLQRWRKAFSRPLPAKQDDLIHDEEAEELFTNTSRYVPQPPLRAVTWPDNIVPTPERMADFVRDSLQRERVRLYYQPIVDLATEKPVMFETLMRLTDEKNRLVMPPDFLPAAKQFDLLKDIDDAVLLGSIRKHAQLQSHGKLLTLSINLTETAFRNENFMQQFMTGVKNKQINPTYLVFEVSSDALLKDSTAMTFIRQVQGMGSRVAIDYFGGGAKAVMAARSLGFDYMKINALRFADIDTNPDTLKTFRDVVEAARGKIQVIVEKVETQLMYRLCERLEVPYVQGFFIAPPGPKFNLY